MTDIFISYSHRDHARAALFAASFEALGFSVWWDIGLRAGEAFDQVIEAALRAAKAVVVLWSTHSVESRWVRAEATLADRCKTLVPVMIEPCERPIIFELTHTAELAHWQGDADDKAWTAFLNDVRHMVATEAVPVLAATPPAAPTVEETLKPGQSGAAPSLAVLPFTNRSGLADDEIFAEGMVEDVISALSHGVNVRVLGAMATANLSRAVSADPAALGRQLGVRYLLEGNVRRAGGSLRVTTQLLEAATGEVRWTAKFDRSLAELAELQEELVTEVAANLDTQVYRLEMERALKKPGDITAWEAVARSVAAYRKFDAAAQKHATDEARRAVAIAPEYAPGHALLASTLTNAYILSSHDDLAEVARIRAIADRALALAPDDALVLSYVGLVFCYIGNPEDGERQTARAVRKAPGSGFLHYCHGIACMMLNRPDAGLLHFNTAERLMAGSHMMWLVKLWQSRTYRELGRWAEADAAIDESISLYPTNGYNHLFKAMICVRLDEDAAALKQVEMARRLQTELMDAERRWRRLVPNSPTLEADIAIIRALYAATEPGA